MYTGSFLTVIVTSYLFILSGTQKISTCPEGHVNVEENTIITMECIDFDNKDTVIWYIGQSPDVLTPVVTCGTKYSCKATRHDVEDANRTSEHSQLYLAVTASHHNNVVLCEKQTTTTQTSRSSTCRLNVTAAVSYGSASPTITDSPTTGTAIKSPQDKNATDAPVEAIVGGAVAAFVVVIVIVVVVVVIIVRRKRNRERSGKENSHEQQVHYNPEHGTGVALEPPQNADTSAGPPEFGIYAFPGGDEPATIPDNTPAAEEDNFGMYAAPKADVYAAVDKSKQKKNKPATSDHPVTSQAANVGDEYAVVNKASTKKDASNSPGQSEVHIPKDNDVSAAPAPYIYAQVDKTAKQAKTAVSVSKTPEAEEATYAQVQKPKKK